jgi:hypothetical protein
MSAKEEARISLAAISIVCIRAGLIVEELHWPPRSCGSNTSGRVELEALSQVTSRADVELSVSAT